MMIVHHDQPKSSMERTSKEDSRVPGEKYNIFMQADVRQKFILSSEVDVSSRMVSKPKH
jgi:hypothetical protein